MSVTVKIRDRGTGPLVQQGSDIILKWRMININTKELVQETKESPGDKFHITNKLRNEQNTFWTTGFIGIPQGSSVLLRVDGNKNL